MLKSDLRGIETYTLNYDDAGWTGLKSDLRGIETQTHRPHHLLMMMVKIRP